jgi:hypothetical protein
MADPETLATVRLMLVDRVSNQLQVMLNASSETERYTVARGIRTLIAGLSPEALNEWQRAGRAPPACSV